MAPTALFFGCTSGVKSMKIFLVKDVEKVGLAGEMVKIPDGFARNFIIPRGLGVEVTKANEQSFSKRIRVVEHRKDVVETKTSMLAEKIRGLRLKIKRKMHDDGKLYGAVSATEIAELLGENGFSISKNQIIIDKSIKAKGVYQVTVKLTARLTPQMTLEVVAE